MCIYCMWLVTPVNDRHRQTECTADALMSANNLSVAATIVPESMPDCIGTVMMV